MGPARRLGGEQRAGVDARGVRPVDGFAEGARPPERLDVELELGLLEEGPEEVDADFDVGEMGGSLFFNTSFS